MLPVLLPLVLLSASLLSACSEGEGDSPAPTEPGGGATDGGGGAGDADADANACEPKSCAELEANCGLIMAGCGQVIDCGGCTGAGESCGYGGVPNVCGKPGSGPENCPTRLTCQDHAADCGPVADGCGGSVDCGSCSLPQTCGGAGRPSVCGTPGESCNTITVTGSKPPQLLVVLDRSGSMTQGDTNRWAPAVAALRSATLSLETRIEFGLMPFPGASSAPPPKDCSQLGFYEQIQCEAENASGGGGNYTCTAGTLAVPVALSQATVFESALSGIVPTGSTPTAATLIEAGKELAKLNSVASPRRQYVLLITDGEPNCGRGVDETIAEIEALAAQNIQTFVVGYDITGTLAQGMDRMAQAGGTGATKHTTVTSEQSLTAAIDQIGRRVDTCRFEFAEPITDPTRLSVKVNEKELVLNQADGNGFTLDASGRVLTLVGAACGTEIGRSVSIQNACDQPTRM